MQSFNFTPSVLFFFISSYHVHWVILKIHIHTSHKSSVATHDPLLHVGSPAAIFFTYVIRGLADSSGFLQLPPDACSHSQPPRILTLHILGGLVVLCRACITEHQQGISCKNTGRDTYSLMRALHVL